MAVLVYVGLTDNEWWPFTSWRLFSQARTDHQQDWRAYAVGPGGEEVEYPMPALGQGYRGFDFLMPEFEGGTDARRAEICEAWIDGASELIDVEASEVRIYRVTWLLSERRDDRALPPDRMLRYVCTPEGAREA